MVAGYETQEYKIDLAGRTLRLLGPKYPHALNEEPRMRRRFEEDGYKPYWAEPWPGAVMLAEHVIRHVQPGPQPILELGAGLGIVGMSLTLAGHQVVVTDYDEDALAFVRASARLNQIDLYDVRRLDWREPPPETFAMIVGSEVAYERRNHNPLAILISTCLETEGRAFLSDLNRRTADEFPDTLCQAGLRYHAVATQSKAIAAFDATDERMFNGRIFSIHRAKADPCGRWLPPYF